MYGADWYINYVHVKTFLLEGHLKELQDHREMESKMERSRTDKTKVHDPPKSSQLIEEL